MTGREVLRFDGRVVGEVIRDGSWYVLLPTIGSPAHALERRWRNPDVLRRAVMAECEAAKLRKAKS